MIGFQFISIYELGKLKTYTSSSHNGGGSEISICQLCSSIQF